MFFDWFFDISARRQVGMSPNPITYSELIAWQQAMRFELSPFEIRVLIAMDSAYLNAVAALDT